MDLKSQIDIMKHLEHFLSEHSDEIPPEIRAAIRGHIGHGNNARAAKLIPWHLEPEFRAAMQADHSEKVQGEPVEAKALMYKDMGGGKPTPILAYRKIPASWN